MRNGVTAKGVARGIGICGAFVFGAGAVIGVISAITQQNGWLLLMTLGGLVFGWLWYRAFTTE